MAQAEDVGGVIEIAPGAAPLDARDPPRGIDAYAFQARKIDNDAVIAGPEPRNAMASASHGESQPSPRRS